MLTPSELFFLTEEIDVHACSACNGNHEHLVGKYLYTDLVTYGQVFSVRCPVKGTELIIKKDKSGGFTEGPAKIRK